MKNKLVITCLLIASIMAVAGCSKKEEEPTVDAAQDVEDAAEEEEEAVPGKCL